MSEVAWKIKNPSELDPKNNLKTGVSADAKVFIQLLGLLAINAFSTLLNSFNVLFGWKGVYPYSLIVITLLALPYIAIKMQEIKSPAVWLEKTTKNSKTAKLVKLILLFISISLYILNCYFTYKSYLNVKSLDVNGVFTIILSTSSSLIFLFAPKSIKKFVRSSWLFMIQSYQELRKVEFNNINQVAIISICVVASLLISLSIILAFNFVIKSILKLILP